MEFRTNLLPILALLFVGLVVGSHGAPSSEEYWKKVLPNTPMPKAIEDSLQSDTTTEVNVGSKGVDVSAGKPGKGGTNVHVGKGKGVYVDVKPGNPHPFIYAYAATKTQLNENPKIALFFLEKDLKLGTQMNLHFTTTTNGATFLPRPIAESIPFSSDKISKILGRFGVAPGSNEAQIMKETIKECEEKGIEGEDKYCATSLESMLDYTTSKLGKGVDVVSTYVEKGTKMQKYVFTGVSKLSDNRAVACHKQSYAYAVFYCHKTETTKTYMVSLVGVDGVKVKAVVVCHTDTSKWNPNHLAFQVLNIQPGTLPICHFLPQDHIVWVPKF